MNTVPMPAPAPGSRTSRWVWVLLSMLVVFRVMAWHQPLGPDQGIYTYVGQRLALGEVPYRDAWDQKPPGLHAIYAGLWALWPHESVVPLADAAVAALTAVLLVRVAPSFTTAPAAGPLAAFVLLLLGNPSFSRLGGVRVRGQGEVFIGLFVAGAVWVMTAALDHRRTRRGRLGLGLSAGALIGAAALVKYPAAAYLGVLWMLAAFAVWRPGDRLAPQVCLEVGGAATAGSLVPVAVTAVLFVAAGAWDDLWQATVIYNLRYAGETYGGIGPFLRYLLLFPVQHARVDGLWLLGGAGAIGLCVRLRSRPDAMVLLAWFGFACVAIAVNGQRGLPQYFLQALPVLALMAGVVGGELLHRAQLATRLVLVAVTVLTVPRVVSFPDAAANLLLDARRTFGVMDDRAYLQHFGGRPGDKYSAPDIRALGTLLERITVPGDTVYVFGFSSAAYVYADRRSASRFFWSIPVMLGFNEGEARYGIAGVLDELARNRPRVVALQRADGGPTGHDSASWFLAQPALRGWLMSGYTHTVSLDRFEVWQRRTTHP